MDWIPTFNTSREVTQKLETPVIYFYSPKKIDNVRVTVDFPKGFYYYIFASSCFFSTLLPYNEGLHY
jgi:hypothetical protein